MIPANKPFATVHTLNGRAEIRVNGRLVYSRNVSEEKVAQTQADLINEQMAKWVDVPWLQRNSELVLEVDRLQVESRARYERGRRACQEIIAAIGSKGGPENVDSAAQRAVSLIRELKEKLEAATSPPACCAYCAIQTRCKHVGAPEAEPTCWVGPSATAPNSMLCDDARDALCEAARCPTCEYRDQPSGALGKARELLSRGRLADAQALLWEHLEAQEHRLARRERCAGARAHDCNDLYVRLTDLEERVHANEGGIEVLGDRTEGIGDCALASEQDHLRQRIEEMEDA